VRATRSASTSRLAPPSAQASLRYLHFETQHLRTNQEHPDKEQGEADIGSQEYPERALVLQQAAAGRFHVDARLPALQINRFERQREALTGEGRSVGVNCAWSGRSQVAGSLRFPDQAC